MINEGSANSYCCENISLIENYALAIADQTQTWQIHHRKEIDENKTKKQLINEGRYYGRPAAELIFFTKAEHARLHRRVNNYNRQNLSEETKQKISKALLGISRSEESKQKMSKAKLGMLCWNNGKICKWSKKCPGPEWKRGRLYKNEGSEN